MLEAVAFLLFNTPDMTKYIVIKIGLKYLLQEHTDEPLLSYTDVVFFPGGSLFSEESTQILELHLAFIFLKGD